MGIKIGGRAPNLSLDATGDQKINLAKIKDQPFVVYFYPKDSTPGCTTEGQNFRDLWPEFQKLKCHIFGVSRDKIRSHENFKAKQNFPFELISDPEEKLCNRFDVIKLKKLYGREYMGVERSTFVFDKNGKLAAEWRKVKVKGHAEEVLACVQSL